jgi:hypothetical protein
MPKPSIRYFLIATTVMAICLAVHYSPHPPPTIVYSPHAPRTIIGPIVNAERTPFRFQYVLASWPIRALTFVVGISTLMHVLTSVVGLVGFRRWAFAILSPTLALAGWYIYTVRYLGHQPGSLNEWDHIQIGLIGFTLGFALVSLVIAAPQLIAKSRENEIHQSTGL